MTNPKTPTKKEREGNYVNEWDIKDYNNIHPSHRTRVFLDEDMFKAYEMGKQETLAARNAEELEFLNTLFGGPTNIERYEKVTERIAFLKARNHSPHINERRI